MQFIKKKFSRNRIKIHQKNPATFEDLPALSKNAISRADGQRWRNSAREKAAMLNINDKAQSQLNISVKSGQKI
jgi:hypothetical protein